MGRERREEESGRKRATFGWTSLPKKLKPLNVKTLTSSQKLMALNVNALKWLIFGQMLTNVTILKLLKH